MDKRLENIYKNMENNTLGLDDTFRFKCRGCGKCCKNREDIILTSRDLFNIAKELGRSTSDIIDRYCDVYTGESSRVPIVRLNPTGPEKTCPLNLDKRCVVHRAKPVVCAMFPLGRAYVNPEGKPDICDEGKIEPRYFVQSGSCGSQERVQSVRTWLEKFGVPVEDEFYSLWTRTLVTLSQFFHWAEENSAPELVLDNIRKTVYMRLYLDYDIGTDLMSQFKEHSRKLIGSLLSLKASMEEQLAGLVAEDNSGGSAHGA
jgi:Fe-S-cluster containining protein